MTPRFYISLLYCLPALVFAGAVGCRQSTQGVAASKDAVARAEQKAEGIELSIEAAPAKLRLSDDFLLTLTVRKRANVRIQLPSFEESLRDFSIRDAKTPLSKLDGDFEIVQQIYRVEPTRSGKQTIIPPAVTYFPTQVSASPLSDDESAQIIEADPIEVDVLTEIEGQSASLDQLIPENAPLELPDERQWAMWMAVASFAIFLIGLLLLVLGLSRRTKLIPQLSPREKARLELDALIKDNWSKLDPKRYFVELTGIVRRYIERTTGIRAPEQTTEEFLQSMASDLRCTDDVKLRLREFLESADLVKFAGLKPSESLIAQSLERAERFIEVEFEPNSAASTVPSVTSLDREQDNPGSNSR